MLGNTLRDRVRFCRGHSFRVRPVNDRGYDGANLNLLRKAEKNVCAMVVDERTAADRENTGDLKMSRLN